MQGKHGHLGREQRQLALRLHAKDWRLVDISKEIGPSAPMVGIMPAPAGTSTPSRSAESHVPAT